VLGNQTIHNYEGVGENPCKKGRDGKKRNMNSNKLAGKGQGE